MTKNKYPYKKLGDRLRGLRGSLDKIAFSEELGVTLRTYYRYEKGERKIPDGLLKLAEIVHQSKIPGRMSMNSSDSEMLTRLIVTVEEWIAETSADVSSDQKARLISMLYDSLKSG